MLLSPLCLRSIPASTRKGRWFLGILSLCTLHVLSWSMMEDSSGGIQYGYYLWAASFVVLTGEWMRQTFLGRIETA